MGEFGTYLPAAKLLHCLIRGQAAASIAYATWKDFLVSSSLASARHIWIKYPAIWPRLKVTAEDELA